MNMGLRVVMVKFKIFVTNMAFFLVLYLLLMALRNDKYMVCDQ